MQKWVQFFEQNGWLGTISLSFLAPMSRDGLALRKVEALWGQHLGMMAGSKPPPPHARALWQDGPPALTRKKARGPAQCGKTRAYGRPIAVLHRCFASRSESEF